MNNLFEQYLRATIELPAEEWAFLVPRLHFQTLDKQEVWQAAGQVHSHIAFIETGVLRTFLVANGRENTSGFFVAGSIAGAFTSFLTQTPSSWTLQALTPCRLVSISYDLLQELYARHSCWLRLGMRMMETQFLHKCRRETAFLLTPAAERYAALRQQFPTLEQQVPQYYLASYLGITPETLSRVRTAKA
jgi:CRP-like cAMP-binding protein